MFKKKMSIVIVSVLVLAVVIAYMPSLEKIVKSLTHKFGSQVTQTDVNLGGFDLSLRKGEASLSDLTVANPKDYKTPYAFELGDVAVKIDVSTVTSDIIVIDEVEIVKPVITYEMLNFTKSNLKDIQNNIASFTPEKSKDVKEVDNKVSDNKESSKKLIITDLYVRNGSIKFLAPMMGKEPVELKLPLIHLKDIGKEKEGASVAEVVSKDQLSKAKDKASEELDKAKDKLKGFFN